MLLVIWAERLLLRGHMLKKLFGDNVNLYIHKTPYEVKKLLEALTTTLLITIIQHYNG